MGVHRQGEGGRTAISGEDAQHLAELAVLGSPATKLCGDAGGQHAMLLQHHIVLGDEQVLVVTRRGARRKFRAQLMHEIREIASHGPNPLTRQLIRDPPPR
jgi:hypothetical protein